MFLLLVTLAVLYFNQQKKISNTSLFAIITFLLFIFIGIASITFKNSINKRNHYSFHLSKTKNSSVLIIDEILKPNSFYNRYIASITTVNSNNVQGKILLNVLKDSVGDKFNIDDKLFVSKHFNSINEPLNPYQFNYKNYLAKQQIHHQLSVTKNECLLLNNDNISLKGLAFSIRKEINNALKKYGFKGDELAIINALLLGQRQEISKDIMQNYQNAGAIHILAVSGLHVGIILLMLNFLLKPIEKLKYGATVKLILIVILLWLFAFIAGLSASIVRAVTMFTAVAVALSIKRSKDIYKILIISIFFLLLFNPYYLFNVGFQLSYAAVFFIVWTQPMLYNLWKPKFIIINYFWRLLTVSVAAQFGVLPLSLFYFHQFPGLFFVANLLIIPFLGLILGLGILIIALALLKVLPSFVAQLYENIIFLLNSTVEWIAKQESFLFQNISFTFISLVISLFFIISFFKWIEAKKLLYLKLTLIGIVLFQTNTIVEKYSSLSKNELVIFNKPRHTILGIKKAGLFEIHHDLSSNIEKENMVKGYLIGTRTKLTSSINIIDNIYTLQNKNMLVIDSLGIYATSKFPINYVFLKESPNINLERLVKKVNPELIIADASNYKSHIQRWEKTCRTYNIKFHYTVKNGAFIEKI